MIFSVVGRLTEEFVKGFDAANLYKIDFSRRLKGQARVVFADPGFVAGMKSEPWMP